MFTSVRQVEQGLGVRQLQTEIRVDMARLSSSMALWNAAAASTPFVYSSGVSCRDSHSSSAV
jgi:hypothetical protein